MAKTEYAKAKLKARLSKLDLDKCMADLSEFIAIPDEVIFQVKAMLQKIVKEDVWLSWGLPIGTNNAVLLLGPSGTGKTLLPKCIAAMLGIKYTRFTLADVIGRYQGETEALIRAFFKMAQEEGRLLHIDEADSMFIPRSKNSPSLNSVTSELLMEMEMFAGLLFLSANRNDLDSACVSRISTTVELSMPDEKVKGKIWEIHTAGLPTKLTKDEIEYLCEFPMSGRDILQAVTNGCNYALVANKEPMWGDFVKACEQWKNMQKFFVTLTDYQDLLQKAVTTPAGAAV